MIKPYYENALLSDASYAELDGISNIELEDALIDSGFTPTQATDFVRHWRVADHQPDTTSGFSATVFERLDDARNGTGEFTIAMRGTMGLVDIGEDIFNLAAQGVAREQAFDLYRYYKKLTTPEGQSVEYTTAELLMLTALQSSAFHPSTTSVEYLAVLAQTNLDTGLGTLDPTTKVDITGHSLGGHLSMLFTVMFPLAVDHVYTYNGAGLGGAGAELLDKAGFSGGVPVSQVTNIVSDQGIDITAGVGFVIGDTERIFIEQGSGITSGIHNHSIANAADSLAIYNLLASIDASATLAGLSPILAATVNHEARSKTLERVVYALSDLFMDPIEVTTDDREALYQAIHAIETELFVDRTAADPQLKPIYQNLEVVSLPNLTQAQIVENANSDIGYRYALTHLNPFAIVGSESLYDDHNQQGELNLYDETTQEGEITEAYLADRTAFLATLNAFNITNDSIIGDNLIEFQDWDNGAVRQSAMITATSDNFSQRIFFGDEQADTLSGGGDDDRLYGGAGKDTLNGGDGDDYLEGNAGIDKLDGGDGNDELRGGAGDDGGNDGGLSGGVGSDALYGEAGNDTLDGGTGRDLLVGGLGQDHLLGGEGIDILFGDHRYLDEAANQTNQYVLVDDGVADRLEGGNGDDLYYAGAGDVINDADGQGAVCMNVTAANGEQVYVMLGLHWIHQTDNPNVFEEHNTHYDVTLRYTLNDTTLTVSDTRNLNNTITLENFSDDRLGISTNAKFNKPHWLDAKHNGYWFDWNRDLAYTDSYNVWWPTSVNLFAEATRLITPFIPLAWETSLSGELGVYQGTDWGDPMTADAQDNRVNGGRGDDLISGDGGNDWLSGDEGNDTLDGGEGADHLFGGAAYQYIPTLENSIRLQGASQI
ncbi:MAG: hypothetical protein KZQ88_11635 [Candidatus Thiodiazotropha sp. (ex Dulcina madagascariensis)]|nr:hypothetical protein [Candidatus Thiodiazotropha sp. (ex Dulcina madagascariensis)]